MNTTQDVAKLKERQKWLKRVLGGIFAMILVDIFLILVGAFSPPLGEVAMIALGVFVIMGACLAALTGMTEARIKALR